MTACTEEEARAAAKAATPIASLNAAIFAGATVGSPAGLPIEAIANSAATVATIVSRGKLLYVRPTAVQEREVLHELHAQLPARTHMGDFLGRTVTRPR